MKAETDSFVKLPKTRTEQFFDLIKNRFFTLSGLSILIAVFVLPLVFWFYLAFYQKSLRLQIEPSREQLDILLVCFKWNIMIFVIANPFLVFFSLGLSGAFQVIQLLIWRENINLMSDFFKGIKTKGKFFGLLALIFTIILFLWQFNFDFYLLFKKELKLITLFGMVGSALLLYFSMIIILFMFAQFIHYEVKFKNCFKNAIIFSITLFPKNILFSFIIFCPFLLTFFISLFGQLIYLLFLAGIGFSLMILIWLLYATSVFDVYINKVKRGLVQPN